MHPSISISMVGKSELQKRTMVNGHARR